ncbi:tripartite tricarboxylate transporter substrate binding protein [Pigmentiphaga soli]|uniref:Tripartite tricarboxylate transporter substrate binding protein n=1 Tax=Pigmentiphaga soli TaxID=1007095 RepID=A0ABP8GY42_9BURK
MPTLRHIASIAAAVAALHTAAPACLAQTWTDRPTRVLVGQTAGGSGDFLARLISNALTQVTQRTFVVENRVGASGMIASDAVARSEPDGHTVAVVGSTHARLPALFDNVPYDTLKSFKCVGLIAGGPYVLAVHPSVPATTLPELIDYLKKHPSFFGDAGVGSGQHMSAELFKHLTKVPISQISYKGGGAMQVDLLAGRVSLGFDNPSSILKYIQQGGLRAIAITDTQRFAELPDVPTMAELGYPEMTVVGWFSLLASAGTPQPILDAFNKALNTALARPDVIESLRRVGSRPLPDTPAACDNLIAAETRKWGDMLRSLHIQKP